MAELPHVAILCGGRGVRLRPLTEQVPKPMVPVNGRPMLDHVIDFYEARGIRRFTLCAGYRADVIREHYADAGRPSVITISEAGEDAGMLRRLWALRDEPFDRLLVAYGDTFVDLDLDDLIRRHEELGTPATILTAEITNPFGLVDETNGRVTSFREKPVMRYYVGCALFERDIFSEMTPEMVDMPDGNGLVALFHKMLGDGRLGAYLHGGLQLTFNTHEEHRRVESEIGSYYTYSENQ